MKKDAKSSDLFEDLFELAPSAYFVFTSDGIIINGNLAFCALLNKEKEDIRNMGISSFLSPKSKDAYDLFSKDLQTGMDHPGRQKFVFLRNDQELDTELFYNCYVQDGRKFLRAMIFDISEMNQSLRQMIQQRDYCRIIAEQSHDILFEYDMKEDLMLFSPSYYDLTGESTVMPHFKDHILTNDLIFTEDIPLFLHMLQQMDSRDKHITCDLRLHLNARGYIWYRILATLLLEDNVPCKLIGTLTDIDSMIKERDLLLMAARTDSLTKLFNKTTSQEKIEAYLRGEGTCGHHSLFVIDVDNFKTINDQMGHLFGDAVLTQLSNRLTQLVDTDDIVGRIGGDEFVIFLKNTTIKRIETIAQEIGETFCHTFSLGDSHCPISTSIGIGLYPEDAVTYLDLFRKADTALYNAKLCGKNCFQYFSRQACGACSKELMNEYLEADPHEERKYSNILLITNIIELLLHSKDIDNSIMLVLSMLGNYYNLSHACLMEYHPDTNQCSMSYQWYPNEHEHCMDVLQQLPPGAVGKYKQLFNEEGLFYCYDNDLFKTIDTSIWLNAVSSGLKSSLQCALTDDDIFYGFISMDTVDAIRVWNQEDSNSFMLISKTIGAYLFKLRAQQQNIRYANLDILTGLWNINKFMAEVTAALPAHRTHSAVIYLDIRNFSFYNDHYGYSRGDSILIAFSERIKELLQNQEMVTRVTADQFVVLLYYDDLPALENRLDVFMAALSSIQPLHSRIVKLVVIAGVYLINDFSLPVAAMIDRANLARKSGKTSHKSKAVFYNEPMEQSILMEKFIESTMEAALDRREFFVLYQPQIDFSTGEVVGTEALVRWRNNAGQIYYPDTFIPVFEKNGFIVELDFYVLEEVCRQLNCWQSQGLSLNVSVNFSRMHIFHPDSIKRAVELLSRYELDFGKIEIEITESVFIDNLEELVFYVQSLQKAGFSVAMDDFGSGYSSLATLINIPIDILKLDREFLHNDHISGPGRGRIIIESTIEMAHKLGITIIAEGVETAEQAIFLKDIGCDMAQGYLFAKPLKAAEFAAYYEEHKCT